MIDTKELGAGSYPEPKEPKEISVKGTVMVAFSIEGLFPKNWSKQDIEVEIEENYEHYKTEIGHIEIIELNCEEE